jgi:hypothetical protein
MDNVWAASAAFVLMASCDCRLLMAAGHHSSVLMLMAGGFLVTVTRRAGN